LTACQTGGSRYGRARDRYWYLPSYGNTRLSTPAVVDHRGHKLGDAAAACMGGRGQPRVAPPGRVSDSQQSCPDVGMSRGVLQFETSSVSLSKLQAELTKARGTNKAGHDRHYTKVIHRNTVTGKEKGPSPA